MRIATYRIVNFIFILFNFSDNFEFTRTKPRTRNIRDVSKVNSHLIEASTGLGVIQIAIGGCTFLAVLSIALAVYLYKNKWSYKHSSQTLRDHPC